MSTYFMEQGTKDTNVAIGCEATAISNAITMEANWEPLLSASFLSKYKIREFCGSMSSDLQGLGSSAQISTVPGTPVTSSLPSTVQNQRVNNPTWVESIFKTFSDCNVKTLTIRQLITAGKISTPVPHSKVRPELPQCLGYHTKDKCNTACANSHDHVSYTASKLRPLEQWCQQCYPADQAAAAAALAF
eukprot:5136971-Ditylum_brightwellii.AAC.1